LRLLLGALLSRRQHLVDLGQGVAFGAQVHADEVGQLGGVGAQHGLDQGGGLVLRRVARDGDRCRQAGGAGGLASQALSLAWPSSRASSALRWAMKAVRTAS
jgi:hypothetical protein